LDIPALELAMSLIEDAIDVAAPEVGLIRRLITPARAACFALAIAVGVQEARIDGLLFIKGWKPRALTAEKALAEVKAAQPKAAAAQAAVNHQPAVNSAAIAKVSDNDAQAYYAKGRAAGAAYAAAHPAGGVCATADQRVPGGADLSGADHAAPVDDRSGDAAGMVAVTRAVFDQLTANSTRLAKVHQDAESLIASGVAVAETDTAKGK
jgi:hypothetical protein